MLLDILYTPIYNTRVTLGIARVAGLEIEMSRCEVRDARYEICFRIDILVKHHFQFIRYSLSSFLSLSSLLSPLSFGDTVSQSRFCGAGRVPLLSIATSKP